MKLVVYTAIVGGTDILRSVPPPWMGQGEFIAFTDPSRAAPGWTIRPPHTEFIDPVRNARHHKLLPHRWLGTDVCSLWIDGTILVKAQCSLEEFFRLALSSCDLAVHRHRTRNCVYDEAIACLAAEKDDPAAIGRQMREYRSAGHPAKNGLVETMVLARRHTDEIIRFGEAWHNELCQHSRRDQLSFNYTARRLGLRYATFPETISGSPHFMWTRHPSRRL